MGLSKTFPGYSGTIVGCAKKSKKGRSDTKLQIGQCVKHLADLTIVNHTDCPKGPNIFPQKEKQPRLGGRRFKR